jgi:hypothetical protein
MLIPPLAALLSLAVPAVSQDDPGLVGSWNFDEGAGDVAQDLSGRGNTGHIHGPQWVKQGEGHALAFDGVDDWVDCGEGPDLDLTAAATLEAWVYPETLPPAEPMIVGKYYDSFGLTQYKDGRAWFYVSGGGNNVAGTLPIGQWSHLVGTFDGTTMALWVNGERLGAKASKTPTIAHGGKFLMGVLAADPAATDPGYSGTSYWRGRLDEVRLYNRALTDREAVQHYRRSAGRFGVDTTWFDRLRVETHCFPRDGRVLATCDYRGVFPLPEGATLTLELRSPDGQVVLAAEPQPATAAGLGFTHFTLPQDAAPGYTVRAALGALEATEPVRPPTEATGLPTPDTFTVGELPTPANPAPYQVDLEPGGGLTLRTGGRTFRVESSYSVPNGGFNKLAAGEKDADEPAWEVSTRTTDEGHEVTARGRHYSLARRVRSEPGRLLVQDTIRNETDEDLGLFLDNWVDSGEREFHPTWVAGYPNATERKEAESPSTFMAWGELGIGVVPLDDVSIVHCTVYARDGRLGVADREFGLAPRAEYTVEWAIYPCASPDYYDFLNAARRDLGRTGTVDGVFAFLPRTGVTADHVATRGVRYGSFGCLTNVADDPQIEIEGIDFLWLPKERARLKAEFEAIRQVNPNLKLMFHIAHSLVSTNRPAERFPDSRVLDAAGNQVLYPYDYDACAYFSRERHEQGWRWYIYYPTPGNSFHDALMQSVDVLVDDIGATGAFMDGFMYGYGSRYTYDRWDGHTVELDPETHAIKRKVGSVLLLSQPSLVEFAQRMHAKGAVVVANGTTMTRTIGELPLIVDQECSSGPNVHLAQTPCALGNPGVIRSEIDVYRDALDKLKWGVLYFYYGEGSLSYPSLPREMYPITVESIHSGTVRGRERIVTLHSGVYGWPGSRELHQAYRFNALGLQVPAEFVSTADADGVRTEVRLDRDESAVLKRLPVSVRAAQPANLRCVHYGPDGLVLELNGSGKVDVLLRNGEFPVQAGGRFAVEGGQAASATANADGLLTVTVRLDGPTTVEVTAATP